MKHIPWILLAAVLVLASCAPASNPTPTAQPATSAPIPTAVPPSAAPALVPIALAGPGAGTTMTWLDGSTLVYIPAGAFTMGMGIITDAPVKNVSLDSYWITQTDITNRMYAQCVATGSCAAPAQEVGTPVYSNPDYVDYPVVGVTWDMASNYCRWIQGQLPTEAQWEKAARGPNGNIYPWGNDTPSCDLANLSGCLGHTSAVDNYPGGKSTYGLLDMVGNVLQWVNDYYGASYYDSAPSSNPTGPASGDMRVIRGSGFETDPGQAYSALRHPAANSYHSRDLGFRCVVNQPKALAPLCQTSSYIPTGTQQTQSACQQPVAQVQGTYCQALNSYVTVSLPQGAIYQMSSPDFSCTDDVVNGQRILSCNGPMSSSAKVTICNASCGSAPSTTGGGPACDPGYTRDPSSGACVYSPISGHPGVTGCPQGYKLVTLGGTQACVISTNQNGQCPTGLYLDSQYGACAPASGQAYAPYGVDNADLAGQTYQGCAAGYTYSSTYQCCQANTASSYPGCPVGYSYDANQKTCTTGQTQLSGPGCVTLQLETQQCGPKVDACAVYLFEPLCIRSGCHWNTITNTCQTAVFVKPTPKPPKP